MTRLETRWTSPHLGKEMRVARWGHWGKPLLLFPTATADHLDVERFGMVAALGPFLDAGVLKVYSIEAVNRESWLDKKLDGPAAAQVQEAYNRYVMDEVIPFVEEDCHAPGIRLATAGASFGCYQAANAFFRRPDRFQVLVGLSGRYDLHPWVRRRVDAACYLNSPLDFVPGLRGPHLKALKKSCSITMVSGRKGESPRPARAMARVLRRKKIPYKVDVWARGRHDWAWWNQQLPMHLARVAGQGHLS